MILLYYIILHDVNIRFDMSRGIQSMKRPSRSALRKAISVLNQPVALAHAQKQISKVFFNGAGRCRAQVPVLSAPSWH